MFSLRVLGQLRALRSVPPGALLRRAVTYPSDLAHGDGRSSALVNITLEVTYRCNLSCSFCFLQGSVLHERRDELSAAEIGTIASQARRFGAGFFLTGGEPLLRDDLPDIVRAIRDQGLRVGMNTNGLLLDAERGSALRDAGLSYLIISLHGPRAVHDAMEGRSGAFDLVVENLGRFIEKRGATRVLVNCVVSRTNHDALVDLVSLLRDLPLQGLLFQHETFLTPSEVRENRSCMPDVPVVAEAMPAPALDTRLVERQMDEIERIRGSLPVFFKPGLRGDALDAWYGPDFQVEGRCLYLYSELRVQPDGLVSPCQVMPAPVGNLRRDSLHEIMNSRAYREFRLRSRKTEGLFPACARCCKLYRNTVGLKRDGVGWQATNARNPQPAL